MATCRTNIFLYSALTCQLLLLFQPVVGEDQARRAHGSLQLIADQESIEPRRSFYLGLRFELEKDWHIYWINPGDSGEPPTIQWDLPAGFHAGELLWPAPERLEHPPLTDYGYEGEVLLMASVRAPSLPDTKGTPVILSVDVKWLVCRDICIPEHERVSISLPIHKKGSPPANTGWHALFERTKTRLPKPSPSDWNPKVRSEGNHFILSIESGSPNSKAIFFPLEEQQIENAAPQPVSLLRRGVSITLQKSDQLLKPIARIKGVVVWNSGQAFLIDAPVLQK